MTKVVVVARTHKGYAYSAYVGRKLDRSIISTEPLGKSSVEAFRKDASAFIANLT